MLKYILFWFVILVMAMMNGILRESVIKKFVDNLTAHQLSTLTFIIFFSLILWFIISKWPPVSSQQAILIGITWLVMTLIFEFGFGYYRGKSWEEMFADYNLLQGRLWIFIPVWVTIAPYLFYKWKQ